MIKHCIYGKKNHTHKCLLITDTFKVNTFSLEQFRCLGLLGPTVRVRLAPPT